MIRALRHARHGVDAVRARGVRARDSAAPKGSWPRIPTTWTPRCGSPPRTRPSGTGREADKAFDAAAEIAPDSPDVRIYRALHLARGSEWQRAVPLLEQVLAESPDRLPALEALAQLRERQGRSEDALAAVAEGLRAAPSRRRRARARGRARHGRRSRRRSPSTAFEKARSAAGHGFRPRPRAGRALPRGPALCPRRATRSTACPASHPGYAMALFKRAQVSVLLGEPDRAARIERARQHADATTRELIARERLFQAR